MAEPKHTPFFRLFEWLCYRFWDVIHWRDQLAGNWITSWTYNYLNTGAYWVMEVAYRFLDVDVLLDPYWDDRTGAFSWDAVGDWVIRQFSVLRAIVEDSLSWIRLAIGTDLGLAAWQCDSWYWLLYWYVFREYNQLFNLWQMPDYTIRQWVGNTLIYPGVPVGTWPQILTQVMFLHWNQLFWLLVNPDAWLRTKVGVSLGLNPGDYDTWPGLVNTYAYYHFRFLWRMWEDPLYYTKQYVYEWFPGMWGIFEYPRQWAREKASSILGLPHYFWWNPFETIWWWLLESLETYIEKQAQRFVNLAERVLNEVW